MDFKDQIKLLSERVIKLKDNISTEEATKTAFILPFIQTLGYDVFDPTEVIPEFTCDVGIKKGEKIDYAIHKDSAPAILVECKHWKEDLNSHNGQLFRYFHVSKARFGILTNGIVYRFYTDLVEKNKMDEKPFFEFNMERYREAQVDKLREFHKSYFDVDSILNTASELKYTNENPQCHRSRGQRAVGRLREVFCEVGLPRTLYRSDSRTVPGYRKTGVHSVHERLHERTAQIGYLFGCRCRQ